MLIIGHVQILSAEEGETYGSLLLSFKDKVTHEQRGYCRDRDPVPW